MYLALSTSKFSQFEPKKELYTLFQTLSPSTLSSTTTISGPEGRMESPGYTSWPLLGMVAILGEAMSRYDWPPYSQTLSPFDLPFLIITRTLLPSPQVSHLDRHHDSHGTSRPKRRRCLSKTQTPSKKLPGMYTVSSGTQKMWRRYDHVLVPTGPESPCRCPRREVQLLRCCTERQHLSALCL